MTRHEAGTPSPLVSVILPTRDRLELLRRAVESVRAQSEQRFELIVVDDVSTDGTAAYLAELAQQDARVLVTRNVTQGGGGAARNEGIRLSRGTWVAFIDDDDEWMPDKLERQLRTLSAHAGAVACSCSVVVKFGAGRGKVVRSRAHATVDDLLMHNWLNGASVCLCSGATLRAIGGFDPQLHAGQDLDLWVRLRQRGEVAVCGEPLALHRYHPGPRITTNAASQYRGGRRFYFKYRTLMSPAIRRHRIAHNCYVMSTEVSRRLPRRVRFLALAVRHASLRFALSYLRRSLPPLLSDALTVGRSSSPADAGDAAQGERK